MPALNAEVWHRIKVIDLGGSPVTGLTGSAFSASLVRRSGTSTIAASETVSFVEIVDGYYWATYTPTAAATLYVLSIAPASAMHIIDPSIPFEDDIVEGSIPGAGPYLTTLEAFKTAWGIDGSGEDARINALLSQVTDLIQEKSEQTIFLGPVTEYPPVRGVPLRSIELAQRPVVAITSLHLSFAIPRVYDATTLLVEGTDYLFDTRLSCIDFVSPRFPTPPSTNAIRVIYDAGFQTVPPRVSRAAQEVIGVKLMKGKDKLYHFQNESRADGSMAAIRFDDLTPNALEVIEGLRDGVFA